MEVIGQLAGTGSLSTMKVPGIEPRSSGLGASTLPGEPSHQPECRLKTPVSKPRSVS